MTQEKREYYTNKISQANKTSMITIIYEIILTYYEDALETKDSQIREKDLKNALRCIDELMRSLNLTTLEDKKQNQIKKDIIDRFVCIYDFIRKETIHALVTGDNVSVANADRIICQLHECYLKLEKEDNSDPVYSNQQTVYAGLTYSKGRLVESVVQGNNRGLKA